MVSDISHSEEAFKNQIGNCQVTINQFSEQFVSEKQKKELLMRLAQLNGL
jgi:hypothetical protein